MAQLPVYDLQKRWMWNLTPLAERNFFLFPYKSHIKRGEQAISTLHVSQGQDHDHIGSAKLDSFLSSKLCKTLLPGHIQLTLRIFDTKRVTLHLYLNLKWPNFSRLWAVHSVFIVQKQRSSCDYGIQSKLIICAKLSV